MKLHRELFCLL